MEKKKSANTPAGPAQSFAAVASSRRHFIGLVGGGAVLAAAVPLAGCTADLPEAAVQPWRNPDRETDIRRFMLAHALLAPNPHNRQPWIADLREAGRIHLICDGERLLPETDPVGRQVLIGCGAFVELAVIAAAQRGVAVKVELFPGGAPADLQLPKDSRVATLILGESASTPADPLFAQIVLRHTRKTAYASDRALPDTLLSSWAETATRLGLRSGVAAGAAAMDPIRRIAREAYEIEATTANTWLESARLMRIGPGAIAANPDGISLNSPLVRALHAVGLFDPMEVPVRGSKSLERVMERWVPFETASGFFWLASPGNTRPMQVAAGRVYVRSHLLATAAGVDMHPLSQALQEFPEMRGPYEAIHKTLGLTGSGETLQMLSRVGFAVEQRGPSPRRSLGSILRT
ncbi:MAG: twin-arginine translocation pathway signal protein [Betaproteobacteria bacterium]|nr:twin-arginine translocation pathway signal protein [Betaproteobacteria bacterium]